MELSETGKIPDVVVWRSPMVVWGLALLLAAGLGFAYKDVLAHMIQTWDTQEEYSYGYIIPFISLFLIWQRKDVIERIEFRGAGAGIILVLLGICLLLLGKGGDYQHVLIYSLLTLIAGLTLAYVGKEGFKQVWVPLLFLFFMVPLPNAIFNGLSTTLQSLSSKLGVAFIKLFGISVNLEGNVIDLGTMQLQVVEACSGLRYLFPLLTLAFISAYFYKAPFWKRAILVLSSIPITVFLNSFRIGFIGITVEFWGKKMAEGFLHDFEGWAVFMACTALLILEMWVMARFGKDRQPLIEVFGLEFPEPTPSGARIETRSIPGSLIVSAVLALATTVLAEVIPERVEHPPIHEDFASFPMKLGEWTGNGGKMDQIYLDTLRLTDYLLADYVDDRQHKINFYVAYYSSQSKGNATHSPKDCLPGGGWELEGLAQKNLEGLSLNGGPLRVNRTLIKMGDARQLTYYWFQMGDRVITNEYMVRWYIFWDALTRNRTDGALIRLITPLKPGDTEADADRRLTGFIKQAIAQLPAYVPK